MLLFNVFLFVLLFIGFVAAFVIARSLYRS